MVLPLQTKNKWKPKNKINGNVITPIITEQIIITTFELIILPLTPIRYITKLMKINKIVTIKLKIKAKK